MKSFLAFLAFTLLYMSVSFAQVGPAKMTKVTKVTSATSSAFVELSDSAAGKSYLVRKSAISAVVSGTTTGAQLTITEVGTDRLIYRGSVDVTRFVLNNTPLTTAPNKVTAIKTFLLTP